MQQRLLRVPGQRRACVLLARSVLRELPRRQLELHQQRQLLQFPLGVGFLRQWFLR